MTLHTQSIRLLDAPLVETSREEWIERMADTLINGDAYHNERDAVRLLQFKGYGIERVCMLAGEACYLAKQIMIAREISA